MSAKDDAVLVIGLSLGLVLIAWYAKKAASDALDDVGKTVRSAWESAKTGGAAAVEAAVDAVTPPGAGLYDGRPPTGRGTKKTEFTLGDINDGAIY